MIIKIQNVVEYLCVAVKAKALSVPVVLFLVATLPHLALSRKNYDMLNVPKHYRAVYLHLLLWVLVPSGINSKSISF